MWSTLVLAISLVCLELIPGIHGQSTISETTWCIEPDIYGQKLNRSAEDKQCIPPHMDPANNAVAHYLQLKSLYDILKRQNIEFEKLMNNLKSDINATRLDFLVQLEENGKDFNKTLSRLEHEQEERIKTLEVRFCPSGVFLSGEQQKSCYMVERNNRNWQQAELYCATKGGHLAGVETEEKNAFIIKYLKTVRGEKIRLVWFGGHDRKTENLWEWVGTGKPVNYTAWDKGEPNNMEAKEDCMHAYSENNWKWNDRDCSDKLPFLCEYLLS